MSSKPRAQQTNRGVQRQSQMPHKPVELTSDLLLFEKLKKESFRVEKVLDSFKDAANPEVKEVLLQNFCVLIFKLVGLNGFIGKLEGMKAEQIDSKFLRSFVEEEIEGVSDFTWVFTEPKEEHQFIKINFYTLLGSLFLQNDFFERPPKILRSILSPSSTEGSSRSFFEEISRILVVLSRSRLMKVRQNCVRLTRLFMEQGVARLEKLENSKPRGLDEGEETTLNNLKKILSVLSREILCARVSDKYAEVSADAQLGLEIYFLLSTRIDVPCLETILPILNAPQSLSEDVLCLLSKIDWTRNRSTSDALISLFQKHPGFRQRMIYFSNATSLTMSLRSIQLITTFDSLAPNESFSDQELLKIMASILHPYEEVRQEALKIFFKFLNVREKESRVLRIHLEGGASSDSSDETAAASIQAIFPFKGLTSKLVDIQHRVYQVLNQIDPRLFEKEQLVENLVESLAFELGPLYDFSSIFKLLVKLPESDLGETKYAYLKLMVLLLRKTMGVLARIASGAPTIQNRFTKAQQTKLLVIQSEFFSNLLANAQPLLRIMREDHVFKEQIALLFLSIPPIDLKENLKESTFVPFAKNLSEIIFETLTGKDHTIESMHGSEESEEKQQMSLAISMFALLQYCLQHLCKERVLEVCVIKSTERLHRKLVVECNSKMTSNSVSSSFSWSKSMKKFYITTLIRVSACSEMMNDVGVMYSDSFVQKWLEITDNALVDTSSSNVLTCNALCLHLSLYVNMLSRGLAASAGDTEKLKAYLKYRMKLLRQTWLPLREDKRKTIEFNLDVREANLILRKSFMSTIDAINFISNKRLTHLPLIHVQLSSDDTIFNALAEYLIEICSDTVINHDQQQQPIRSDTTNAMESEEIPATRKEQQLKQQHTKQEIQLNKHASSKQLADVLAIVEKACSLVSHNPLYIHSHLGIVMLQRLSGCSNKQIADTIRKTFASTRLEGSKQAGFTPFWRAFDLVIESYVDSGKETKGLVAFTSKAYFQESYSSSGSSSNYGVNANAAGDLVKAKKDFKELMERLVFYLTAKLKDLLDNPSRKIYHLESIGALLCIRVKTPKSLSQDDINFINLYKQKFHTLFLKKVQDYVVEFKANNKHLLTFEDSVISTKNQSIVHKFIGALEIWSGVKLNIDPFGNAENGLNSAGKSKAEKSSSTTATAMQEEEGTNLIIKQVDESNCHGRDNPRMQVDEEIDNDIQQHSKQLNNNKSTRSQSNHRGDKEAQQKNLNRTTESAAVAARAKATTRTHNTSDSDEDNDEEGTTDSRKLDEQKVETKQSKSISTSKKTKWHSEQDASVKVKQITAVASTTSKKQQVASNSKRNLRHKTAAK